MRALLLALVLCSCSSITDALEGVRVPVAESTLVARALEESFREADADQNGVVEGSEWSRFLALLGAKIIARWGE